MSTDLSNYDIYLYKGNTFKLDFKYTNNINVGIDLSNYEANMQIRRSAYDDVLIGEVNENYPTGSFGKGLSGDFISGQGITGFTGGLILNYNGVTGDVHIEIDSETSYAMPLGKNSYDLQLYNPDTGVRTTILRGRFQILSNTLSITRSAPELIGEPGITGGSGG